MPRVQLPVVRGSATIGGLVRVSPFRLPTVSLLFFVNKKTLAGLSVGLY